MNRSTILFCIQFGLVTPFDIMQIVIVTHAAEITIFTVRRYALHGLSYRNSVRLSVCPSVCHTRGLCPHGSTYDHDFFTIW